MIEQLREKFGNLIEESCNLLKVYLLLKVGLEQKAEEEFKKEVE